MNKLIGILNHSRRISEANARLMTRACQKQMTRDVAPAFGTLPWKVRYYKRRSDLPKRCIGIVIFDHPDQADTMGYHSEDEHGRRFGRVFVDPSIDAGATILGTGDSVAVTLSHEVIEAYTDPGINMWGEGKDDLLWAYEVCDPVEETSYRIKMGKRYVGVANFVYPSWFDLNAPRSERFDHMKLVKKPFQIAPGGSAVTWDGKNVTVKTRRTSKSRLNRKNHHLARTYQRCMSK